MNTTQIKYFLDVIRYGGVSNAAKENFVSQPDISKHIHNLEKELGISLFDRKYKNLVLTEAGEIYYRLFLNFMGDLNVANAQAAKIYGKFTGCIRIGVMEGITLPKWLYPAIRQVREEYPDVEIVIRSYGSMEGLRNIQNGMVDILIHLKDFLELIDDLVIYEIETLPKYFIYSEELLLSGKKRSGLSDFSDQLFLAEYDDCAPFVESLQSRYCQQYGFSPLTRRVPNKESVMRGVENCEGVSIMDASCHLENYNGLRLIEMQPPHIVCIAIRECGKSGASDQADMLFNKIVTSNPL